MTEAWAKDNATIKAALLSEFAAAGYARCEPPILHPAKVFLDLSGEDIRSRLYLTSDASGAEFCLRPEYTIPVCLAYLASADAGKAASFSYCGPVFRFRPNASGEFVQAGLESFGRADREAADAEILALSLQAAEAAGGRDLSVRFGDAGLFSRLLDQLALPAAWLRRIKRGHAQGLSLDKIFAPAANGGASDHSGVLAALEGVDKAGAKALVEDLLSIAGISSVGGRSVSEIADRFLEQSSARASEDVAAEKRAVLEQFLAISGDPDAASARLRALAADAGLDLGQALDGFDARLGFIAARGLDVSKFAFATGFARNLDYYTGFVFEAHAPGAAAGKPAIGGGRYDNVLASLEPGRDIPAVGAAIWVDRLSNEGGAA